MHFLRCRKTKTHTFSPLNSFLHSGDNPLSPSHFFCNMNHLFLLQNLDYLSDFLQNAVVTYWMNSFYNTDRAQFKQKGNTALSAKMLTLFHRYAVGNLSSYYIFFYRSCINKFNFKTTSSWTKTKVNSITLFNSPPPKLPDPSVPSKCSQSFNIKTLIAIFVKTIHVIN